MRQSLVYSFTQKISGETFLYEGILGGLHLISKMPEKSNKFLVVFTDGEDLNSQIKKEIIGPKANALKNFSAYAIDFMPSEAKNEFLNKSDKSTGIGLSIVKKIVNLYHGDIWIESELGKGTIFYFTIKK